MIVLRRKLGLRIGICRKYLHTRHPICPVQYLNQVMQQSIKDIVPETTVKLPQWKIEKANIHVSEEADFQCNAALGMARVHRTNPRKLAEEISQSLKTHDVQSAIDRVFVSGPGFINVQMNNTWLGQRGVEMALYGTVPVLQTPTSSRILVDFGSPNFGKELHVGHLRSSVIGDTIARILEFQGNHVTRISHVGDMGAAIATLIVQFLDEEAKGALDFDSRKQRPMPSQLSRLYEEGKRRLSVDKSFAARVHEAVLVLQSCREAVAIEEKDIQRVWKIACDSSRIGIDGLFKRLGVNVRERGESTYRPYLEDVVNESEERGLVEVSDGAKCIFIDGKDKSPMIIQKQDDGYLYATTDLAALKQRLSEGQGSEDCWGKYDRIMYVTDSSQRHHFRQLFAVAEALGWYNPQKVKLEHIPFGLVLGADGSKLSSRKGVPVSLEKLLDEAVEEARKHRTSHVSDEAEKVRVADTIANGAVRYFELSHQREKNYQFSFEHALNTKGNTSVYVNYAMARLESIRMKHGDVEDRRWESYLKTDVVHSRWETTWEPSERNLVLLLTLFSRVLEDTGEGGCPHMLCDYLNNVTTCFHSFYEACPILKAEKEEMEGRLRVCAMTYAVLNRGLHLVGVMPVLRM